MSAVAAPAVEESGDPVAGLWKTLGETIARHRNRRTLHGVGGNILVCIEGVGAWTVVTRGPRTGLYDQATDDPVQAAMYCTHEVMTALLDGNAEADPTPWLVDGSLQLQGDVGLIDRLLALVFTGDDPVSIRLGMRAI